MFARTGKSHYILRFSAAERAGDTAVIVNLSAVTMKGPAGAVLQVGGHIEFVRQYGGKTRQQRRGRAAGQFGMQFLQFRQRGKSVQ